MTTHENGFAIAETRISACATTGDSHLDLSYLGLSRVPEALSKLTQLRSLNLSRNRLTTLPSEVAALALLEDLYVQQNRIIEISDHVAELRQLRRLYAYKSQIRRLSPQIGELTQLADLKLHNNKLTSLPPAIGKLRSLQSLYVNHNQLDDLPAELGLLSHLSVAMVDGNPLPDTTLSAAGRGPADLLTYLRSLLDDSEALYDAKLILVGEGGVGKTSLVAALTGLPFIEDRDTTHGIEMSALVLPHPDGVNTIKLNVWDFGGQPVYRVTHQFFYSKRALYLLLWTPRRGVDACDVEGWLKRIRLRIGDAATVLIISTGCDTGGRVARIDEDVLRLDYGDIIAGFHNVDSRTGSGIGTLKVRLAEAAARLPQMGSRLNLRWKAARDKTLKTRKARISFADFTKICRDNRVEGRAPRTLADLLHDLGYIVYYGDDEGLKEDVILQPEWLTKAIGYVLEDPIANDAKGVVAHDRLREIWRGRARSERDRYPDDLHPFFLRLMEKYDVSYRLEGGASSLVAQLVPNVRPDVPWTPDEPLHGSIPQANLVCQMEEEPPGLIPWLIVRTHHFATQPPALAARHVSAVRNTWGRVYRASRSRTPDLCSCLMAELLC